MSLGWWPRSPPYWAIASWRSGPQRRARTSSRSFRCSGSSIGSTGCTGGRSAPLVAALDRVAEPGEGEDAVDHALEGRDRVGLLSACPDPLVDRHLTGVRGRGFRAPGEQLADAQ